MPNHDWRAAATETVAWTQVQIPNGIRWLLQFQYRLENPLSWNNQSSMRWRGSAVYEFPKIKPHQSERHKKPQSMLPRLVQMVLVGPFW